jgi:Uma2 family endonuclease
MLLRLPSKITDADLLRMGADNPGYQFEREEDGSLIVSPTSTKCGAKSGEAFAQLYLYAKRVGGKAYDSSTGFAIGPGSRMYTPMRRG